MDKDDKNRVVLNLENDREHCEQCHKRWVRDFNREMETKGYEDDWYAQQCGCCKYYIPLRGVLNTDYGGCTNPRSPFDRRIMFEHDGCEFHDSAGDWVD